jgi:hypothetical protein
MRHLAKAAVAPASAAVPLFVTACSSASSTASTSAAATSSASTSATSAATSLAPGPAGDAFAALTADQIASKANADLKAATCFHVSGSFGLTKGASTVISGQSVLQLREGTAATSYVTDSAIPEYVRVDIPGSEQLTCTGINAPVSITPLPASEVIGS